MQQEKYSILNLDNKDEIYLYLNGFDCGKEKLNKYMFQCIENECIVTHILYNNQKKEPIGVCMLCCSSLVNCKNNYDENDNLDEDRPCTYLFFPALEIKYFALDVKYQDTQFDDSEMGYFANVFLSVMLSNIRDYSRTFSKVNYVTLYSVEDAIGFYSRNGFSEFDSSMAIDDDSFIRDCLPMCMVLD